MIIAITGGTGFIGSALVDRHLSTGDEVRVLSRRLAPKRVARGAEPVWFRGDFHDPSCDFRAFVANADILYHCAGEIHDPAKMHAVHVRGTGSLADCAAGHIGRWVQLSSVGAYGPRRDGTITEETACAPVGPYETTKTRADEIVAAATQRGAFPSVVLRPSNVIGPNMPNRSFFQLIAAIHRGLFVFMGAPGACANYIHVDNVVEALVRSGKAPVRGHTIYNISDHCSFEKLVLYVCDELQCRQPRLRIPRWSAQVVARVFGTIPGFPLTPSRVEALTTRAIYSIKKISDELGYRPIFSIEDAVRQMAAAWRDNAFRRDNAFK